MKTLHQCLKESTHSLHRQLDQHPIFISLLSHGVTANSSIQQALQFWWGFHCAAQRAVYQPKFNRWKSFLESCNKLGALKDDMDRFHTTPFSLHFRWPDVNSTAELMALLYIAEGSMLGGLAIQKVLRKRVLACPFQLDFLTLYEPNTLEHWKEFILILEDASRYLEHAEVQMAAVTWFSSLIDYADEIHFRQSDCKHIYLQEENINKLIVQNGDVSA